MACGGGRTGDGAECGRFVSPPSIASGYADGFRSGKNAFALSKVLGEAIGRSFIETALDSSVAHDM